MSLDVIKSKLDWNSPEHFTNLEQLVRDVRLMFKNAYTYNAVSYINKHVKKKLFFF